MMLVRLVRNMFLIHKHVRIFVVKVKYSMQILKHVILYVRKVHNMILRLRIVNLSVKKDNSIIVKLKNVKLLWNRPTVQKDKYLIQILMNANLLKILRKKILK